MGFLEKLFRLKNRMIKEETEDDWEQIVYDHAEIDFEDVEQRGIYITNCLEQIEEASKEKNLLSGEYGLVTAYLTDMEEIEALPAPEHEKLEQTANRLLLLEQERQRYFGKKDRMRDSDYYRMRKQEDEMAAGIVKLRETEEYHKLVKQDMRRLDRERHAYEYRRKELDSMLTNLRGMAVIFLVALGACLLMLAVLQFVFKMNAYVGFFLAVMAAAIAITVVCVKYMDAQRESVSVEKSIGKLIQLQNKVKIRYVNNKNLLDYLCMKYDTENSAKLEKLWQQYQEEKEERKQFEEAEAKTEYYQKELIKQLSAYRVSDPVRWINQVGAILDPREMVEIRHELILRRQALRKQMDYNNGVAQTARDEIMSIVKEYPKYAEEIMAMVDRYEEKNS